MTAEPERWSAAVLEPLLVTGADDAPRPAPPWPEKRKGEPNVPGIDKPSRWIFWISVFTFFIATSYLDDPGAPDDALWVAIVSGVVAVFAAAVPKVLAWRRPGRRLRRACAPRRRARRWRSSRACPAPPVCSPSRAGNDGSRSCTSGRPPTTAAAASSRCARSPRATADDLDAVTTFCAVAGEARLRTESAGRSAHYVRTLMARLGRVPARIGEPALWREPLAWAAAPASAC